MWQKIVVLCLVLGLLVACGAEPTTQTVTTEPPTAVSSPTAPPPATATARPTVEPTAAPTQPPTAVPTLPPTAVPTISATAVPTITIPTMTPTAEPETAVSFEGISFTYDTLASEATTAHIPAAIWDPNNNLGDTLPDHYSFQLLNYPHRNSFHTPHIEIYDLHNDLANSLMQLLQERPAAPANTLPFYPHPNAGQPLRETRIHYLDFVNGSGVAYLTYHTQAIDLINNEGLFYTFQGITHDGKRYISAIFPVAQADLPAKMDYDTFDVVAFDAIKETYYNDIHTMLDSADDSTFTPPITSLDALIQTLEIEIVSEPVTQLTVDDPVAGGLLQTPPMIIHGRAANDANPVAVQLMAGGLVLAAGQTTPSNGNWWLTAEMAFTYRGPAQLLVNSGSESVTVPVTVLPSALAGGPAVGLSLPYFGETAVSDAPLYVDGWVRNPSNNSVTIGLLVDGCTSFVTQRTTPITPSAFSNDATLWQWAGALHVPAMAATNDSCVVAYMGNWGEGNLNATALKIPIQANTNPTASRIDLSRERPFNAGQTTTMRGTAVNAEEITVVLVRSNDGQVIAQGSTPVDEAGFWELSLPVPSNATEGYVQARIYISKTKEGTDDALLLVEGYIGP